uniref:Secreted protein n=1 Tax=Caenorhabditis tropicalis TaxID=1561998 RepID=A0A1I7TWS9_9PELO
MEGLCSVLLAHPGILSLVVVVDAPVVSSSIPVAARVVVARPPPSRLVPSRCTGRCVGVNDPSTTPTRTEFYPSAIHPLLVHSTKAEQTKADKLQTDEQRPDNNRPPPILSEMESSMFIAVSNPISTLKNSYYRPKKLLRVLTFRLLTHNFPGVWPRNI